MLTLDCSPLTTHYSLLTTHYSLLSADYSLFTTRYSILTTDHQLWQVRPPDFDAVVNASAVAAAILGELRWREAGLDVEH